MVRLTVVCMFILFACSWTETKQLFNNTKTPITVEYRVDTTALNRLDVEFVQVYYPNTDQQSTNHMVDEDYRMAYTVLPGQQVNFAAASNSGLDSIAVVCAPGYPMNTHPCMPVDTFSFTTNGHRFSVATQQLESLFKASGDDLGKFIALLR